MSPAAVRASRAIPCAPPIAAKPVTSSTAESIPQASAVTQQPTIPSAKPPASTGTRPTRSISRPAGIALSAPGEQEDRRAEPEDPFDPGHEHERGRRDGDAQLQHPGQARERPGEQGRVAHDGVVVHASNLRRPSRKALAPPWDGCLTAGAPSASSARRPTAITRRSRASSSRNGREASISARDGRRFEAGSPGRCGCVGTTFQHSVSSSRPELGERAPDDRRGRLGRPAARELALGGERDSGDARAAVAGRLADEQKRRCLRVTRGRR